MCIRDSYSASYGYGIEQISFSDGVTWNLNDILAKTATNGTANADSLAGTDYADNIYGLAGADALYGYAGNDTLNGGLGIDTMDGGAGNDRYVWQTGDGSDIISDSSTLLTETDTLALSNVASTLSLIHI